MPEQQAVRPTLMTRLAAVLRGEVSAETVEAYRRAGAGAYEDLLTAEKLRDRLAGRGATLWQARPGELSQLLCTWNAFALQTLGDQFVEADYTAVPRTVGYLPPVTAEQAAAFLGEVEQWSSRARRAARDPGFDVAAEVSLPASLPAWVEAEPCPRAHLAAMLAAVRTMRDHVQAAQADFARTGIPAGKNALAATVDGMVAEAEGTASYAESLWSPNADAAVHQRVENSVKCAIERYYLIGQLLAMPALLDRPDVQVAMVSGPALPVPGQAGFDPWCLTDPASRASWKRDPAARRAIDHLWRCDPDPAATLTIQAQIDAALRAEAIAAGTTASGAAIGNYYCCPWSAIYLVRAPVVIAGRRLRPGDQFTLDVSAEEIAEGGPFKRALLVGPFHPTNDIDYCDPASGGRHG
ncbi:MULTISPECIES: hypothetical protein [Amycolatopsis]|uniref:Uncharacterized protein n=1 Tax=Amycolatopsis echigonensis TaxID=2576905 RepID=A0A2N3WLE3_9PSEU|nr:MULTISPECIES: hypothetical protein [Amycolatopsis]MBB2500818.1 hypothetical protein [Amycolatopsis echigonensis]MCG3751225.1 hypothetical protein [Amycolatopsis sp. Poz14]PKV94689.1 hypothetical protein ATK30_5569 [Amycolatopsis niigatensis]